MIGRNNCSSILQIAKFVFAQFDHSQKSSIGSKRNSSGVLVKKEIGKDWCASKMWLAEFVVVFPGVYGVFRVDNYRDEQDREERTRQMILSITAHRRLDIPHQRNE